MTSGQVPKNVVVSNPTLTTAVRESCIVQVVAEVVDAQVLRPSTHASTKLVAGSGVIVNAREGLVVSNAHVTGNALNITVYSPVTGKMPLHCELVSIMRERDLSLLRIQPDDLKALLQSSGKKPEDLNAHLVDHLALRQGCHLYAAGFPLGTKHVQVTTGCLSGLASGDSFFKLTQFEDSLQRDPTFIVTSAGLNHGMSGGGLFDESGGLVGIITAGISGASQIGYAIPSRVVMANYQAMLESVSPTLPTLHFRWTNVSESTVKHLSSGRGGKRGHGGMMVRHVLPDSVLHGVLRRGDLLVALEFDLPVINRDSLTSASHNTSTHVKGTIETHGDVTLSRVDGKEDARLSGRKFAIPELIDYVVAGSKMKVSFTRRGELRESVVDFEPREEVYRIRGVYHVLNPIQWLKVGGVVMQNTTLNSLAECARYKYIAEIPYYDDLIFTPSVIVTYIEPSSEVGSLSAFAEGDLVIFVNGREVKSIDDIRKVIGDLPIDASAVSVETDRGALAMCPLDDDA